MPIVNFWVDDKPLGTEGRNGTFLVGHFGFFMFNFLNVCYLTLFEGLIFQRFRKNPLLKLAFFACFVQIFSCVTSIHRYNIDDEYGIYGRAGTLIGIVAFVLFNFPYLYLIFQSNTKAIRFGMRFLVVAGIACCFVGEANWETKNFTYFRIFIGFSIFFHIVALMIGHRSLNDGSISIDASIASKEAMLRMFRVLIFLDVMSLTGGLLGKPILTYPLTGLTFSVMVIAITYVGRMDFMTAGYEPLATTPGGGASGGYGSL
jgi:hypothetical protein